MWVVVHVIELLRRDVIRVADDFSPLSISPHPNFGETTVDCLSRIRSVCVCRRDNQLTSHYDDCVSVSTEIVELSRISFVPDNVGPNPLQDFCLVDD